MSILKTFRFSSEEKRSTLTLIFLLGFSVIVAITYFIWGAFLNFGHLSLEGEAPFVVKVYKSQEIICSSSPCLLKLKPGSQSIFVQKEGYKPIIADTIVQLWSTSNLRLSLEVVPELIKTDQVPANALDAETQYELVVDELTGIQKLVANNDQLKTAIVLFQNPLKEPRILGNYGKYLLIITKDDEVFKIDLRAKSREKLALANPSGIISGTFSPSGRYFLFADKNSDYLKLLDTNSSTANVRYTLLQSHFTFYDWLYNDSIIFLSPQTFILDVSSTSVVGSLIQPLAKHSTSTLLLGEYSPFYDEYVKLDLDLPLSSLPDSFVSALSGSEVYMQKGDEKFKIILRKF